jgi:hypothetical protein
MKDEKKPGLILPDDIEKVTLVAPRDLVIIGQPKIGKGAILGDFTKSRNALVFDLEKGGYEYIEARKISTYESQETTPWGSYMNYVKIRNALLDKKGKYEYLIIDGLSDLDTMSEMGGTLVYMNSVIGKNFNRIKNTNGTYGAQFNPEDPEFKSVLTLPDGAGYMHTRKWFMAQVEIFTQISPYRLYAAHIADKYIKDNAKEEVIASEIALTGQLKRIFASKVTSLAKIIADGDERFLNFDVLNDSILAGSRAPQLKGRILISRKEANGNIKTFWDSIYPPNS